METRIIGNMWRIWGGIDRQRRGNGGSLQQRTQLSNSKTEYIQNEVGSPSWIERWIFHSLLGGLSKRQIDQILKEETKVVKPESITVVPTYNKRQQQKLLQEQQRGEQEQQQQQQQQQGEQQQQQQQQQQQLQQQQKRKREQEQEQKREQEQQRKRKREQRKRKRQHDEKLEIFMETIREIDPNLLQLPFNPRAIQSVLDVTPESTRNLFKFRGNLSTICTSSDVKKYWIKIVLDKMKTIATSTDPAKLQKYEETVLQPIYKGDITLRSLYKNLDKIEHLST